MGLLRRLLQCVLTLSSDPEFADEADALELARPSSLLRPTADRLPDAAFPRSGEPGDVAAAVVRAEMSAGRGARVFVSAEPLSSSLRGAFEAAGWTKPKLPWPR